MTEDELWEKDLYISGIKYAVFNNVEIIITLITNQLETLSAPLTIYHLLTKPPNIGIPIIDRAPTVKQIIVNFILCPIPYIWLIRVNPVDVYIMPAAKKRVILLVACAVK